MPQPAIPWRRYRHLVLTLPLTTFLYLTFLTSHLSTIPHSHLTKTLHPPNLTHLLIPASHPSAHLCKTLLSSTLLSYPTPTLINWGLPFTDTSLSNNGSHVAKLRGLQIYLSALPSSQDDELVLIVDGYDVWFQLDPEVLVGRYERVNREANERIGERMGRGKGKGEGKGREDGRRQTVVFSSQKKCWPGDPRDWWCWAVPTSLLPGDLYGEDTDLDVGDGTEMWRFARVRQRWLNSGIAMGPVGAMRKIFERAVLIWETDTMRDSDQGILAEIFGTQEFQRRIVKEEFERRKGVEEEERVWWKRPKGRNGRMSVKQNGKSVLSKHPTHRKPFLLDDVQYEFGIGLDYWSELGQPTVFAEFDLEWVRFADKESLQKAWHERNVTNPMSEALSKDIVARPKPFHALISPTTLENRAKTEGEKRKANESKGLEAGWEHVKLFSNLWTGVTPALIHHNAHRDNLKQNRESMWKDIWFQPLARELLQKRLGDMRGEGSHDFGGGEFAVKTDGEGKPWIEWNELCDEDMQQEVLRDGEGPFVYGQNQMDDTRILNGVEGAVGLSLGV